MDYGNTEMVSLSDIRSGDPLHYKVICRYFPRLPVLVYTITTACIISIKKTFFRAYYNSFDEENVSYSLDFKRLSADLSSNQLFHMYRLL